MTRPELASLVNEVLNNPHAVGKTFEVRRDESDSGLLGGRGNWGEKQTNFNILFRRLVKDEDRVVSGLSPFPVARDPPAPLTEEQVKAVLADPRVVRYSYINRYASYSCGYVIHTHITLRMLLCIIYILFRYQWLKGTEKKPRPKKRPLPFRFPPQIRSDAHIES